MGLPTGKARTAVMVIRRDYEVVPTTVRRPAAACSICRQVRRVRAREEFIITGAGHPGARLVAVGPQQWRGFEAIAELFGGPADTDGETDRGRIDQTVRDPWTAV
jgi:antitoxin (DNA-binding transcriptional repressor) of toxin-antitoxin stability system